MELEAHPQRRQFCIVLRLVPEVFTVTETSPHEQKRLE